jgi:lipopolysaccharide biosynthesis regulator YciM
MPSENTIYLAALLFISALLGYLFLKFFDKDDSHTNISPEYLKGLKFLLNEQADKAINLFSEIVQFDDETIETHLALGVLFRKQGKIDQAVKLHQNIIEKKELPEQHYYQALEELAEDYYFAGLYDKSEELFIKLINIKGHRITSLNRLIQIYEFTCNWHQAISTLLLLNKLDSNNEYKNNESHYLCQIAENYISNNDLEQADQYIDKARKVNPKSERILFLTFQIELHKGNFDQVIKLYKDLAQNSNLGHLVLLPEFLSMASNKDQAEKINHVLQTICSENHEVKKHLALLAIIDIEIDEEIILEAFYEYLSKELYFKEILLFNETQLITDIVDKKVLNNIRIKLNKKVANNYKYRCNQCGYHTIKLTWQCPTCRHWETASSIDFVHNNN